MNDHEIGKEIATLLFPKLEKIVAWHAGLPRQRDVDYVEFTDEAWDVIVADAVSQYPTLTGAQWYRAETELNWALSPFARKIEIAPQRKQLRVSKVHTGTGYCFNSLAAIIAGHLDL